VSERLILLQRRDCHLCEEATALLARLGYAHDPVDVDGDAVLASEYGHAIPVLLFQGREILRAPISEAALRAALTRAGVAAGA
jgi:hypothetical protein